MKKNKSLLDDNNHLKGTSVKKIVPPDRKKKPSSCAKKNKKLFNKNKSKDLKLIKNKSSATLKRNSYTSSLKLFFINLSKKFHRFFIDTKVYHSILKSFFAIILMFVITFIILGAFSINPFAYYGDIFRGSLSSWGVFADSLGFASILILTSLAFAIPAKTRLFNIGISGQMMIAGAFTYLIVQYLFAKWNYGVNFTPNIFSTHTLLPVNQFHHFVELIFILVCCMVIATIWSAIPGMFKAYLNANEVVSTIMLNWIAVAFYRWVVTAKNFGFFNTQNGATYDLSPNALFHFPNLHNFIYGTNANIGFFTIGIFVAILVAVIGKIYLKNSSGGFGLRITGASKKAATLAGVNYKSVVIKSMLFSGLLSGLAASFFYFGINNSLSNVSEPILYGFLAIAVALVGNNNAIGIIFSSIFFGIILVGQNYAESGNSGVNANFGYVIFAITIFCSIFATLFVSLLFKGFKKLHKKKLKINKPPNSLITKACKSLLTKDTTKLWDKTSRTCSTLKVDK